MAERLLPFCRWRRRGAIRARSSPRKDRLGVKHSARGDRCRASGKFSAAITPGSHRVGGLHAFLPPHITLAIECAQHRRLCERAVLQGGMDEASPAPALALFALSHFPLIEPGADLGEMICRLCETRGPALLDQDV